MIYLKLFWAFFRIGLFTFGGGYAMLPMLERECVDHYHWVTKEELLDIFAIGQCTPGVIAVNTATYIGNKTKGVPGAICTTIGIVSPSWIIICLIAALLNNFSDLPVVQHALMAVRAIVTALILNTVYKMMKTGLKNWKQILIATIAFVAVGLFGASPVWIVFGAALFGLFFMRPAPDPEPAVTPEEKEEKPNA